MDCCTPTSETAPLVDCRRCGTRGRTVGDVTLDALLVFPDHRAAGAYRFCRTADCPVVYFDAAGEELGVSAVRVRVGQKEALPDRPICYCFGHSAEDIGATPGIRDDIKAACKRGEDRCPETNPQGSCCLGNVAAVLREAASVRAR
ncbi:MAG: hypothetical protein ACI8PZ_002016 [Myxococcota bacterium]|jgi:hypothetical protein